MLLVAIATHDISPRYKQPLSKFGVLHTLSKFGVLHQHAVFSTFDERVGEAHAIKISVESGTARNDAVYDPVVRWHVIHRDGLLLLNQHVLDHNQDRLRRAHTQRAQLRRCIESDARIMSGGAVVA